jgi:hypothetical protein
MRTIMDLAAIAGFAVTLAIWLAILGSVGG